MIGGSKPLLRQVPSIFDRSCALAICLKFHVSRYFTPLVAASEICSASRGSVSGIALDFSRAFASSSASGELPKNAQMRDDSQSFFREFWVASRAFVDHQ